MDFLACRATLLDLPPTFLRPTAWFTQFMDALAFEDAVGTTGSDDIMAQVQSFTQAQDGWIDVWGLLFGVPRNQGEGNGAYSTRVSETILAWIGTLPACQIWCNLFASGATVTENQPNLGYTINFPVTLTFAQIAAFLVSFNRIRPDGVPFSIMQGSGALYLGTEEYLGLAPVVGSYLTNSPLIGGLESIATTLSAQPILPALLLVDPILNPNLYPALSLP
jgi:hypothetical protein